MMKGSAGHEKEYIVRVKSRISDADLEHFRKGVRLKELDVTTRPCKVERLGDYTFRIILTQGLNRQIRRMCLTLGYRVRKLKRIRVMNIKLGSLKEGACRELTEEELRVLKKDLGLQL
jgi:23S rRNA pseudouridine2604 synthase